MESVDEMKQDTGQQAHNQETVCHKSTKPVFIQSLFHELRHPEKGKIHLLIGYPLVTENIHQTEHHPITEDNEACPGEEGRKP